MARVAELPHEVDESAIVGELKPVIRYATPEDEVRWQHLNSRQSDLIARCQEKITEHELPMSLVKAEYSFDGSRLTFYFTADKRVDFRNLVRDLARTFRTRIELRQIGPRDEAKLLGGIGPCGRILCCASFLPDYARVSIKMAKDQDLPLNPAKISGVCGRLLCCLAYEHEQYIEIKAELPKRGTWVQTPDGPGEVTSVNVLRGTVTVTLAASGVQEEFAPDRIQEATNEVAQQARARNAEGVTPVVRERNRGERRLLRDEFESSDELAALAALEDRPEEQISRQEELGAARVRRPEHRGRSGAPGSDGRSSSDQRSGPRPEGAGEMRREPRPLRPEQRSGRDDQRGPRPDVRGPRPEGGGDPRREQRPPRPDQRGGRDDQRPSRPDQRGPRPEGAGEMRRESRPPRPEQRGGRDDQRPPRPEQRGPRPESRGPRPEPPVIRTSEGAVPTPFDDQYSVPEVLDQSPQHDEQGTFRRRRRRPSGN
jgi:cell fate regulator YaaT (PSP1 superfamily)